MSKYAVITENDESPWEDIKGEIYHFPNTYKKILTTGCKVIYYKGKLLNKKFAEARLSNEPHYFGYAIIGQSLTDPLSKKGDLFCEILEYNEFSKAVPIKINGEYVEKVPESRKANHWRFGVREIDKEIYELIIKLAGTGIIDKKKIRLPSLSNEFESTRKEGKKKYRFTTYYERNPFNRAKAVEIHGLNCMACNFNFSKVYGELGEGYINVHHLRPVSELGEEVQIDPQKDLIVLCANCHAMIHKDKEHTLSLEELKGYIS